jgi:hypothetical protein
MRRVLATLGIKGISGAGLTRFALGFRTFFVILGSTSVFSPFSAAGRCGGDDLESEVKEELEVIALHSRTNRGQVNYSRSICIFLYYVKCVSSRLIIGASAGCKITDSEIVLTHNYSCILNRDRNCPNTHSLYIQQVQFTPLY